MGSGLVVLAQLRSDDFRIGAHLSGPGRRDLPLERRCPAIPVPGSQVSLLIRQT